MTNSITILVLVAVAAVSIGFFAHFVSTLDMMCGQLYNASITYEQTYGQPIQNYPKSCNGPYANPLGAFQR